MNGLVRPCPVRSRIGGTDGRASGRGAGKGYEMVQVEACGEIPAKDHEQAVVDVPFVIDHRLEAQVLFCPARQGATGGLQRICI